MKKILEYIGIIALFCFSFFYTNKAVTVVKEMSPIMVEIKENIDEYNKESVNAIINDDEIIPGVNGCKVDINRSYERMKRINTYNTKLLQFDEIKPSISSINKYDKYIIRGNTNENKVAIIIKLIDIKNINAILDIVNDVHVNFFIDGYLLEKNSSYIDKLKDDNEIYNAGYDGKYRKDLLPWTNSLIDNLTNNKSTYCLNIEKDKNILKMCEKEKMYSIKPSILIKDSNYIEEKDKVIKGDIIYFDSNNITAIGNTITFLSKKGFEFELLSEFLSERGCE